MYKLSKAERVFIEQFRGAYDPHAHWYAIMTHWGRERDILQHIRRRLDGKYEEILLPEIPAVPGEKSGRLLFGGYLFLRCRMSDAIYMTVASAPQVYKIFGRAFRIPTPIGDREMEIFCNMLGAKPSPQFVTRSNIGQQAVVIEGMLKGLSGRVVGVNTQHVKLETSFSFLAQDSGVIVCVPRAHIRIEEPRGIQAL